MAQQAVNLVDLGVALIILVSAIFAFYRGFMRETLAIAGWVGAAFLTIYAFKPVRPYVETHLPAGLVSDVVTGIALFLGSLIIFSLLIHLIVVRVKDSPLNALDRSLGFLFGVARGVVVVALAYLVGQMSIWKDAEEEKPEWLVEARSLPLINYMTEVIMIAVPQDMLNLPADGIDELRDAPIAGDIEMDDGVGTDDEVRRMAQPPVANSSADGEASYDAVEDQILGNLIENVGDEPVEALGSGER